MQFKDKPQGFTLVEIMLVLVIVSTLIYMGVGYIQQKTEYLRINRTVLQMQQIMNASLAYYVANGTWPPSWGSSPSSVGCLIGGSASPCSVQYLPSNVQTNPFGTGYCSSQYGTGSYYTGFQVSASSLQTAQADANIIAGMLPLAYVSSSSPCGSTVPSPSACTAGSPPSCYVIAMVNVPGQNLNNANAVTFAGLYHHGGCIPVPSCPVDASGTQMTPQVFLVPVSVSGTNDSGSSNVYPISSFTAYATGSATGGYSPPYCNTASDTGSQNCQLSTTVNGGPSTNDAAPASNYWRACMQLITEKGNVAVTNTGTGTNSWGQNATMAAFTRCSISGEQTGSTLNVFGN